MSCCAGAGERVSFDPIVAAGANGSKPHAVPGDTVIQPGMFVTMDFGCVEGLLLRHDPHRGGGKARTGDGAGISGGAGGPAGWHRRRPGRAGRAGDRCRRPDGDPGGGVWGGIFPQLRPLPGTGDPRVPNAAPGEERIMPVGAVVSAEPGIYLPGRFGVRIEDVIVLSETGCRDLTKSPKELIVL